MTHESFSPDITSPVAPIPGQYFEVSDETDLAKGVSVGPSLPRYSNGYGDLRHPIPNWNLIEGKRFIASDDTSQRFQLGQQKLVINQRRIAI
jgi:hypothetical protein